MSDHRNLRALWNARGVDESVFEQAFLTAYDMDKAHKMPLDMLGAMMKKWTWSTDQSPYLVYTVAIDPSFPKGRQKVSRIKGVFLSAAMRDTIEGISAFRRKRKDVNVGELTNFIKKANDTLDDWLEQVRLHKKPAHPAAAYYMTMTTFLRLPEETRNQLIYGLDHP